MGGRHSLGSRIERTRHLCLATVLTASFLAGPAALAAQTCPYTTLPPGMPVSASQNHRYFQIVGWGGSPGTVPLLGMSYEYLCHVLIPASNPLAAQYCQLSNYPTVFRQLSNAANNIVRINVIFNSSPGMSNGNGLPFADEEVFSKDSHSGQQGTTWDLTRVDQTFLNNLEMVICTAYTMGLVVQVTLFDPWNHCWSQSPFNAANALPGQGFTAPQYFASFDTPGSQTDTNPQNKATRGYQTAAMGRIVDQIKKYPNIIWEIVNEPDFIPTTNNILCPPGSGGTPIVAVSNVMDWQRSMIGQLLQQHDSSHMLMVNGHETSPSTFAWSVVPSSFDNMSIQTAHYTHNRPAPPFEGVLDIESDPALSTLLASWELGFDENQSLPNLDGRFPGRNADDVRAEAWEFVMGGGGLFNGYSGSMSTPSITASMQLNQLFNLLYYPIKEGGPNYYFGHVGSFNLSSVERATCNQAGSWCTVQAYGTRDLSCSSPTANIYWSTIASPSANALYIHHALPLGTSHDGYGELPCANDYQTPVTFNVQTPGCWWVTWIEPLSGMNLAQTIMYFPAGSFALPLPPFYREDVVAVVNYQGPGPNCYYPK